MARAKLTALAVERAQKSGKSVLLSDGDGLNLRKQTHMAIEDMLNHPRPAAPCVQILRLPQVCKITGLGRSMIYQLESTRRFPYRVRIGARAVGWVEAEVQG